MAITVLAWPLIVLVAPDTFIKYRAASLKSAGLSKHGLSNINKNIDRSHISDEEYERIRRTEKSGEADVTYFGSISTVSDALRAFWNEDVPPSVYRDLSSARASLNESNSNNKDASGEISYSIGPPDWYVGFSKEFLKSISKIDRKMQGRIVKAVAEISASPTDISGNTIKPLSGNLNGLWRYRLGDSRLIYYPHSSSKRITLISFGARGKVYSEVPSYEDVAGQ